MDNMKLLTYSILTIEVTRYLTMHNNPTTLAHFLT